jgi:transmembrane sensor
MGEKRNIRALFDRYRKGIATEAEKQVMAEWLSQLDASDESLSDERMEQWMERSRDGLRERLLLHQPEEKKIKRLGYWLPRVAAACLAGTVAVFAFKFLNTSRSSSTIGETTLAAVHNVTDHSLLRLANGTEIPLGADSSFRIDENTRIHINGHEIRYESSGTTNGEHTILTAKGDRYHVTLPDGSRISLNASSAVTYPVSFDEGMRTAQMSGEAYFEVSKAANWPFTVKTGDDVSIRVLGTAFNINNYKENAAVQTTLVSGSVELNAGAAGKQLLKPSQKAIYSIHNQKLQLLTVDAERETDWVYDRLVFRETPMKEVLVSVARFYNIEFDVKNKAIYKYTFTGTFENKPLERVLDYMKISSRIRYTILKRGEKTIVELK